MTYEAKGVVNRHFIIGNVSDLMFGQFFEPLGRCTHDGMYEPDHPKSNEKGWRQDVMELVREMGITCFRYPGGNFTASYRWEDGVGPREKRPTRLELAWLSIEDNSIGINEYIDYVKGLGAETLMCVNMGTYGVQEACDLAEYCNWPSGTTLSDLRREHGYEQPHNIRYWCIGNEVEGEWQIAQYRAQDYGWLCKQTAKALKRLNPNYQIIAAGSSDGESPYLVDWDIRVLNDAYDYIDGLSIHAYTRKDKTDTTAHYLAHTVKLEQYLSGIEGACYAMKVKKRSMKDIWLSIDEWNVEMREKKALDIENGVKPWMVHPPRLEQIYTMEDVLAFGLQFIVFFKHCKSIKIACMSLLVNCLAPIMTVKGGSAWRQTTFYPFMHCSRYGRGVVLETLINCETYEDPQYGAVPYVEGVIVLNGQAGELTLFAVNKHDEVCVFKCELEGFEDYKVFEHIVMSHDDLFATNTAANPDNVVPYTVNTSEVSDGALHASLAKYSWNVIRMKN